MKNFYKRLVAFSLLLILGFVVSAADITTIWLSFRQDGFDKMVVSWQTYATGSKSVQLKYADGTTSSLFTTSTGSDDATLGIYHIEVNMNYDVVQYEIKTGTATSGWINFNGLPDASKGDDLKIAVISNWGFALSGGKPIDLVSIIDNESPDIIATLGDHVQEIYDGEQSFLDLISLRTNIFQHIPFMPIVANHDKQLHDRSEADNGVYVYDTNATAYRNIFELPGKEWKWTYAIPEYDFQLIGLDLQHLPDTRDHNYLQSCHSYDVGTEQYEWYKAVINNSGYTHNISMVNAQIGELLANTAEASYGGIWNHTDMMGNSKNTATLFANDYLAEVRDYYDIFCVNTSLVSPDAMSPIDETDPLRKRDDGWRNYTMITKTADGTLTIALKNYGDNSTWYERSFYSGPDTQKPTVSSTSPTNNATGVDANAPIVINFSEAIDNTSFVSVSGLPGMVKSWNSAGTLLTVGHDVLSYSTEYTITVSGAKDAAGNTMDNYSFSFTTADLGVSSSVSPLVYYDGNSVNPIIDITGNGHDINRTRDAILSVSTETNLGNCIDLSSDGTTYTNEDGEDLGITNSFTIMAFVNASAGHGGVFNYSGFSINTWDMGDGTVKYKCSMRVDDDSETDVWFSVADASAVAQGTWHHVAFTYDGTDVKIYLDGQEKFTQNYSGHTVNELKNDHRIAIGYGYVGQASAFKGKLDDAKIFNKALTASQIQQEYSILTGNDNTFPTVLSTTPIDGATSVVDDATVSITFSEAMDKSTVTVSGIISTGISWDDNTLNVSHSVFEKGKTYTVVVNGKDLAGNAMAEYSFVFTTESTSTGIDIAEQLSISVYPNPATTGEVYVQAEGLLGAEVLQLYNSAGVMVMTQPLTTTLNRIDLQGLESGIYIVRVISQNGIQTVKLHVY